MNFGSLGCPTLLVTSQIFNKISNFCFNIGAFFWINFQIETFLSLCTQVSYVIT